MELPSENVCAIERAIATNQSMSQPIPLEGDDGSNNLVEDSAPLPDQVVLEQNQIDKLNDLIAEMSERDAIILKLRYGLGGEEPMTLKQIGAKVGLTRERVRQLEQQALKQLNRILS